MQAESSSQDAALQQLSAILEKLETTPDNVPLIKSQIRLMGRLQMNAEVLDATLRLASLIMLSEDEWLSYFDRLIVPSIDLEAFVNIIERFEQAEQDYLSLAILLRHVEFIIGASNSSIVVNTTEEPLSVDPEVQAFLTPEAVREMLHNVVAKGHGLLTESHLLWQPWINWEMSLPGANSESVHELFAKRMAIPHSAFEATSSTYSSYCSENCPEEYERRLVDITTIAQTAKFKWSGEKRFGKTREILEADLPTSFLSYIEWETDPRAQNPKNAKSPSSDPLLTRSIFERAIAYYARAAHAAEEALALLTKPKAKGKGRQEKSEEIQAGERTISAYKTAEANIWERYATWDSELSVRQRAVRACPSIGSAWRHYMNQAELSVPDELPSIFQKALDLGLIVGPSEISDIFVCRAASVNRLNASSGSAPESIIQLASQAFELINHASRAGDPTLRLEKFLLDWSESYADGRLDDVLRLLDKPIKSRAASYQMVLARANVEARNGLINKARETFSSALQRTDLDWPEAVFEAFLQFENVHGDLSTLTETTSLLEAEQLKLAKRRERAQQTIEYVAEAPVDVQMELPVEETADKIAEVAPAPPPAEDDGHFKRDREHTTVLVTGLAGHVEKAEVEAYFVEIGHVREVTLKSKDGQSHALVEFRFADAVPIALDRDGKKLGSNTIRVSMLWRSNLFVTNFPKETDDAALRGMFGQYGTVLDSRWPSRKYADSRRFCYITMDSPAHAQEALVLNGLKLGDFPLTVLISDPSAKSKRTDADDSVNRTLFVGGLTAKTTEHDVEDILRPYGRAQHVKLGWDPIKRICKGFAFVQMETEDTAKACLTLDGSQRQGKFLKIQMSDPNHVNKKPVTTSATGARNAADKRQRTVRLHNLPEGTQEGLLQQALEKIAPVKRVEIFGKSSEAIAELANQSDVGTLLLRAEPFVFNGATITISQQDRRQPHKRDETPASALSFAPRAARRGGKVIGKPRPVAVPVAAQGQDTFRQFVQSKNAELAEGKRKAEEDDENTDAKRQKAE